MFLWFLGTLQIILGVHVILRLFRSVGGVRIEVAAARPSERVSIILPVLNETARIKACLDSLVTQSDAVAEILVVDGGSNDGTQAIVESYRLQDRRVRLIVASPVPYNWAGKTWGLYVGLKNTDPRSHWVLFIDADVRCSPLLTPSLLAHAERTGISTFSVATHQQLSSLAEGLLHPSLLTTLVYRFGIPGKATRNRHQVQANGQCFMSLRDTLLRTDSFRAAQLSLCEDFTMARRLAECDEATGFYESDGLVKTGMYQGYGETWRNWPRSLSTRDRYFGWHEATGLLEVLLVQSLPLPLLFGLYAMGASGWIVGVNLALTVTRLGALIGVARAYEWRPWTYWFSPMLDLPVALRLITSTLRRRQVWRGRVYVRRAGGIFESLDRSETASQ